MIRSLGPKKSDNSGWYSLGEFYGLPSGNDQQFAIENTLFSLLIYLLKMVIESLANCEFTRGYSTYIELMGVINQQI